MKNVLAMFRSAVLERIGQQPSAMGAHEEQIWEGWLFSQAAKDVLAEWGMPTEEEQIGFKVMVRTYSRLTCREEPDEAILEEYAAVASQPGSLLLDIAPTQRLLAAAALGNWPKRKLLSRHRWYIQIADAIQLAVKLMPVRGTREPS